MVEQELPTQPQQASPQYIGRFAPSPSGPLHFGSLVSAVASYLDAKSEGGIWLVRMEDLDPPREIPGAANEILNSLDAHGLHWDGDILYQSQRNSAYLDAIKFLQQQGLLYPCYCTRKAVAAQGNIYLGKCRDKTDPLAFLKQDLSLVKESEKASALRLKVSDLGDRYKNIPTTINFSDIFFGEQAFDLKKESGDFIVRRKDRLFAYQLAVVVDDIFQGITHVIRGSDLLDSTPQQLFLFQLLAATPPRFGHVPVATNDRGQKLSKQHGATSISDKDAELNLKRALKFLGQTLPDTDDQLKVSELLTWACKHWDRKNIPQTMAIPVKE